MRILELSVLQECFADLCNIRSYCVQREDVNKLAIKMYCFVVTYSSNALRKIVGEIPLEKYSKGCM